jgi:hypothetical protein
MTRSNLPDTAVEIEVIAWLREHHPWIWEHSHLELLAESALAGQIEQALDSMCAPGTEADSSVIASEDRPGHLQCVLRSSATEPEKLASRRLAQKRRVQCFNQNPTRCSMRVGNRLLVLPGCPEHRKEGSYECPI